MCLTIVHHVASTYQLIARATKKPVASYKPATGRTRVALTLVHVLVKRTGRVASRTCGGLCSVVPLLGNVQRQLRLVRLFGQTRHLPPCWAGRLQLRLQLRARCNPRGVFGSGGRYGAIVVKHVCNPICWCKKPAPMVAPCPYVACAH